MFWEAMWYWWLGTALFGAVLTLNLHELAHCLVIWIKGGQVTSYKPYPHFVDGKFFWGRMTYDLTFVPTRTFAGVMAIVPQVKVVFFLALWVWLGLILWHPLFALAAWECADLLNFLQGLIRNSKNDGGKFRRAICER